jgi:WD40 repeat protein
MPQRFRPVIRIFVSSTFSDLTAERNALEQHVWPALNKLCQRQGFQFQAIDLRWGVSTEAGLDHRTMRICLDELKRSQEVSPQPNFLILLGDRYGWRPLPEEISANEFRQLWMACGDDLERSTLNTWYRADENAIPMKHLLRSRRDSPDGCDFTFDRQHRDREEWLSVQTILWRLINRAFPVEHLESRFAGPVTSSTRIPAIVRFQASATEQEIWAGALSIPGASEHVVTVSREITNLTDWMEHPEAARFMNTTDKGELDLLLLMELGSLRLELRDLLGENYIEITQQVVLNEVAEAKVGSRLQVSADHLEFLCRSVRERFERLIQRQIDEYNSVVGTVFEGLTPELLRSLQRENNEHARFAAERAPEGRFLGRQRELKKIRDYIDDGRAADESHAMPFVLAGPPGIGKSAVIAAAARDVRNRSDNWPGAVVVERYLGTTRHSSDVRSLLIDLCCCLRQHFPVETPLPADIRLLEKEFYTQLENASVFEPIVIFLDALDQLDSADDALRLWWIRSTPLPEGVRIILSCATDLESAAEPHPWEILNQRGFLRAGNSCLLHELNADDAKNLWNTWMAAAGRSLTVSQQAVIDERIVRGPGACRQPLYLRVLFEESRQWSSWHQPALPAQSVHELLVQVLEKLSLPERHGPLVEPALSCLVTAKYGLAENELLEILFRDRDYRSAFAQSTYHALPEGADRIPIAIWSGLRHDLAPYLTERGAPGGVVLQFFHRQFADAVRGLFAQIPEQKARRHRQLILYFARQHWWLESRSEQRKRMVPPYSARPVNVRKVTELPEHLIQFVRTARLAGDVAETACRWLEKTFRNLDFLEAKNEAGRVFELSEDFPRAVDALPEASSPRRLLMLLEEALRRDIHFIDRHHLDYPQGLFQCLWNSCWWYDCPAAAGHYKSAEAPGTTDNILLYRLLERWRSFKTLALPNLQWLRAERPPSLHLGAAQRAVFSGHKDVVTSVSYCPDGKRIVSGSNDRTIRVWNADGGNELLVIRGHDDSVVSVCFSPDGQRIASASADLTVRIWDATTGNVVAVCRGHRTDVKSVRFSPDGKWIISGSQDCTLRLWNAFNGHELATFHGHREGVTSVAFSPDGKRVVSGSRDKTLRLWDVATGSEIAQVQVNERAVTSVSFSPDGKKIISGSKDSTVQVFDIAALTQLRCFREHLSEVNSISCSLDGHWIASGSGDGTIRIWDVVIGVERVVFSENSEASLLHLESQVNSVAFSPDGKQVVAGYVDKTVKVWDALENHRTSFLHGHEAYVSSVIFSPDSRRVATGSWDSWLRIWDAETGLALSAIQGAQGFLNSLDYSPDGRRLVTADLTTLRLWDATTGCEIAVLRGHDEWVWDVAYSSDGHRIVSGSNDKTVRVWDATNASEVAVLYGHQEGVTRVRYSLDGRDILSADRDGTVIVWNARSFVLEETLRGAEAVSRILNGRQTRQWQLRKQDLDMFIQTVDTSEIIAWFPGAGVKTAVDANGMRYAVCRGSYVCILALEMPMLFSGRIHSENGDS